MSSTKNTESIPKGFFDECSPLPFVGNNNFCDEECDNGYTTSDSEAEYESVKKFAAECAAKFVDAPASADGFKKAIKKTTKKAKQVKKSKAARGFALPAGLTTADVLTNVEKVETDKVTYTDVQGITVTPTVVSDAKPVFYGCIEVGTPPEYKISAGSDRSGRLTLRIVDIGTNDTEAFIYVNLTEFSNCRFEIKFCFPDGKNTFFTNTALAILFQNTFNKWATNESNDVNHVSYTRERVIKDMFSSLFLGSKSQFVVSDGKIHAKYVDTLKVERMEKKSVPVKIIDWRENAIKNLTIGQLIERNETDKKVLESVGVVEKFIEKLAKVEKMDINPDAAKIVAETISAKISAMNINCISVMDVHLGSSNQNFAVLEKIKQEIGDEITFVEKRISSLEKEMKDREAERLAQQQRKLVKEQAESVLAMLDL